VLNIGFIGQGFVGGTLQWAFEEKVNTHTYDIIPEKSTTSSISELVQQCETIFVCLPTPMKKDGSVYLQIIEDVLAEIDSACTNQGTTRLVITKSTVPPGSNKKWASLYRNINLVFNPEFLTEARARQDFMAQRHIILGAASEEDFRTAREIFHIIFENRVDYHWVSFSEAELTKYFRNCFLAMKVSFCNEIKQVCDAGGLSYEKVSLLAHLDPCRLGESHHQVPGPDGDAGFGGHCFPKDLNALINFAKQNGVSPTMLTATWDKNQEVRTTNDWENMKGRAVVDE